ncbi:MAG: CHASE2 domain-containing protein [Bacteroidetes bacterium]|nr:MAG: CHASE2 domain-containing protein [Bacteroidota bacterium]
MVKFLKKLFLNDYIYCSIFVAVLLGSLYLIPVDSELTDPFGDALGDFEITDLAFTHLRTKDPVADTNITIINTGVLGRAELAEVIRKINAHKPAVVGFNEILKKSNDYFGDSLLSAALRDVDNIVYTSKLSDYNDSTKQYAKLDICDTMFLQFEDTLGVKFAETGFENMFTHERDFKSTRQFYERASINGVQENFFAVELVRVIAPERVEKFMKRAQPYEIINYKGNYEMFNTIDAEQALNGEFDPSIIKGKIVILGYLGASLSDEKFWDDYKYYTPLNKKYAGKTFPDMFETVIYANIASQILNNTHINLASNSLDFWLNFIICFLNVIIFSKLFHSAAVWWDIFSLIISLVEVLIILISTALIFSNYSFDINLNFSIVFVLVLGNFLELYYGLLKIAIQKWTIKWRILKEDRKRRDLKDLVTADAKNLMTKNLSEFNLDNLKNINNKNTE